MTNMRQAQNMTAEEAYAKSIEGLEAYVGNDRLELRRVADNMLAQNILHQDLGMFPGDIHASYDLSDEVRDRLIAHARQDAAHAVLNTTRLLSDVRELAAEVKALKEVLAEILKEKNR
jgi:hypothetical protein